MPADLWALGILLWDISAGEGPWGSDPNEVNVYRRITDHATGALHARLASEREQGFVPPQAFVPSLIDLIENLLVPEPQGRLGSALDESSAVLSFKKLKSHAWFASVQWEQLVEGLIPSPLLTSAATHVREQLELHTKRSSDCILGDLVDAREYSGDCTWFAQY